MQENKFFHFVWRFNALLIMTSGLLAVAFLLFALVSEILNNRDRLSNNIVNVDRDTEIIENLEISDYREVKGTSYVFFPLKSAQSYSRGSYSSKSTSSQRNYLFVDLKTSKDKRWLLPDNKSLIVNDVQIPDLVVAGEPTLAILYTLVTQDTNGDRRLTASDLLTIGISKPDGKNYRVVAEGVNKLLGYKPIDDSQIAVVYKRDRSIYSQSIDLNNWDYAVKTKPTLINSED